MKFCHVTLSVKDLDASIRFYTDVVGLSVSARYQSGDAEIAFLGSGETKVELIRHRNRPDAAIGDGVSIGFEVASVPEKLESLKGGAVLVVSPIIQPNPRVRFFYVTDPDGLRVQFLENMNP